MNQKIEEPNENPQELAINRDEKGRILPGSDSLNPGGRPKDSKSIKTRIRELFEEDPGLFEKFVKKMIEEYPSLTWQMLEGRPPQKTANSEDMPVPIPIMAGLSNPKLMEKWEKILKEEG
ncbi:MAG: hypothetical protein CMI53_04045 [Parcubacteria group bacterium]|nr:hypothetical protein [Parcubacteria group bacterium]|tara:strand:+ start:351 stop:710 length:360 start_codon:yes stop_codon:yes gene_type:complete